MNALKKLTAFALALIFIFSLASCGTFKPAISTESDTNSDTGSDMIIDTETETDSDDVGFGDEETGFDEGAFTVALRYKDKKYVPEEEITVYWKNNKTLESCKINEYGYAGSTKLDGDYTVTLSSVPEGKVYNPNIYVATNDDRNIIIDIYDLNPTKGKGRDPYNGIKLAKTAVYSVTLTSATNIVYFDFTPTTNGTYAVESWMDISEGKVNPLCDAYTGSIAFKQFDKTIDGGGAEGLYTKNFLNGIDVTNDMIGNVLTFGIHADAENVENYPVTVVFAVTLNGELDGDNNPEYDMFVPEDLDAYKAGNIFYGSDYKIVYPESEIPGRADAYYFDNNRYKLWSKDSGGDGYYHVYDEDKYSRANYPNGYGEGYPEGYGPILYAQITEPCRFLDRYFSNFEIDGKPLSIKLSDEERINYKHYIEGYTALATRVFDGQLQEYLSSYYCYLGCPCHPIEQIENYACLEGCTNCLEYCRQVKKEFVTAWDKDGNPIAFWEGIQAYATVGGGVAVTEELKTFLLRLSIAQRYYADGEGWMETNENLNIDASDAAQWLFACYYFEKID